MSQRLESISTQMEVILSAIYMATGHMSDENALKQSLRSAALQVMAETIELVGDEAIMNRKGNGNIDNLKSSIKVSIYKTMSFIKVIRSDSMMSDSNADLLMMTYKKLLSFINDYQPIDLYTVTDSIKDIDYSLYTDMSDSNHIDNKDLYLNQRSSFLNKKTKQNISSIDNNINQIENHNHNVNNDVKLNRRTHILDIIKGDKIDGYNMSEILTKIRETNKEGEKSLSEEREKNISEKTVQRELNSMIVDGLIMKKGEKRWSRYVLAPTLL